MTSFAVCLACWKGKRTRTVRSATNVDRKARASSRTSRLSHSKLAGGPAEIAATEEVQMQMENGLACACTVIQHGAIAAEEIALTGKFRGDELQLA
jgi:hypothetical protein